MATHTSAPKGKKIHVILTDNTSFVDKFVESKANYVIFEEHRKVLKSSIRSFSIWQGMSGQDKREEKRKNEQDWSED